MKKIVCGLFLLSVALFASNEVLSMSDADKALYSADENPGELFVGKGEDILKVYGGEKAFAKWLGVDEKTLPKEIATYPKYSKKLGFVTSLEPLLQAFVQETKNEKISMSDQNMTLMVTYVRSLANGEKVNMPLKDAALKQAIANGEAVFKEKRGMRGLACYSCHNSVTIGQRLRMQILPDLKAPDIKSGATWPAYRMTKTEMTTIQKRFQGCMENATQQKLPIGSAPMIDLEAYVTSLSQGQTIAVPGLKR